MENGSDPFNSDVIIELSNVLFTFMMFFSFHFQDKPTRVDQSLFFLGTHSHLKHNQWLRDQIAYLLMALKT